MGLFWILLGMSAVIAGVAAFEGGFMRSPKADFSAGGGPDGANIAIQAAVEALFRVFL